MLEHVIIAGFGGQGILFAGQVLAYAALYDDLQVVWSAIYGPEMRGGTANCTIIVSTDRIKSPLVPNPRGVIAMNGPSFDRFGPTVRSGGVLIVNASLVEGRSAREDIRICEIPATTLAEGLSSQKVANLVALGAYVGATGVVSVESVGKAIDKVIPEERAALRSLNVEAFREGFAYAAGVGLAGR